MKKKILILFVASAILCASCAVNNKLNIPNDIQASKTTDINKEPQTIEPPSMVKYHEQIEKLGISNIDYELVKYYADARFGGVLPNHSALKEVVYEGETKLGYGKLLVLEQDKGTAASGVIGTYEAVYAVIPIEGEELAYFFKLVVPEGEKTSTYIDIMKEQLLEKKE